jgi:hypothetical protein
MPESYAQSAVRHSEDADHLAEEGHLDGAGYLIGYAVECAIKSAVEATRPAAGAPHVHLPRLVEHAKKALQGRRRHSVFTILEQDGFMKGWSVDVRYEPNGHIDAEKFQRWRTNANRTLGAANLRRRPK